MRVIYKIMPLYTLLILKNIVSHGNSNHLIDFCFLGEREGDLVHLKGVRSSGLLRLKDDGYWGVVGGVSSAVPKSSSDAWSLCIQFHTFGLVIYS